MAARPRQHDDRCDTMVTPSPPERAPSALHASPKVTPSPSEAAVKNDPATVFEFDLASYVLTMFGRCRCAGTLRGDSSLAKRYLNLFFRI